MGAAEELARIREEIRADPENAFARAAGWEPLYVAAPPARIVIIGQAPGRRAQESGVPWNDASGVRLREWLGVDEATFRDPELFAILPMDFYYPGKGAHGDLPPRPGFAARWHPRILAQLGAVRLTLLVGSYAQRHYLGTRGPLTTVVRGYRDHLPDVVPLVHPSPLNFRWLARNPWYAEELLPALRRVVREALARRPDVTAVELVGGIEKRALVLADYDPRWPDLYAAHERRIRAALGPVAVRIEHIGSTSVPGLAAKPIIDVLVTVPDITAEEDYLGPLLEAGYELRVREPGHRLVRTRARDVHVHVVQVGDQAAEEYLLFRDRLRADPEDRELYERTKRALVEQDWPDTNAYADAKTGVIGAIKERARRSRG